VGHQIGALAEWHGGDGRGRGRFGDGRCGLGSRDLRRRGAAGGDAANAHVDILVERLGPCPCAIGVQQIGHDIGVLRFAQAGGCAGRHRHRDELVEIGRGARTPGA
jgi:hypothetical protein